MFGVKSLFAIALVIAIYESNCNAQFYGPQPGAPPPPPPQVPAPFHGQGEQETMASAESMRVYYDDLVRLQNIMDSDVVQAQGNPAQFTDEGDDDY